MTASVTAKRWAAIVAAADRSMLSDHEFAGRHGVNPRTLAWWRWKLRRSEHEPERPAFVEVVLVQDADPEPQPLRLHLRNVGYVDVADDSDLMLLRRLLDVLS